MKASFLRFVHAVGRFLQGLVSVVGVLLYFAVMFYLLNWFLGGCTHHAVNAVGEKVIQWNTP
jgi:hypothetical protein